MCVEKVGPGGWGSALPPLHCSSVQCISKVGVTSSVPSLAKLASDILYSQVSELTNPCWLVG